MRSRLESEWDRWLLTLFASYISAPFAWFHRAFWKHIWSLQPGKRPKAFIAIWSRGFAKSTSVELAIAAIAAMNKRRYCLYVSGTQDQADDHVSNVATILESPRFAIFYPKVAARMLSKYGHSKGWRRNRLRTNSGFTVDAIGLDTAARGVKMDEDRPDLIIFDDIDEEGDDKKAVEKKVKALTRKILPAGSDDCAVIGIQNLVHKNSIFSQLVEGKADFLKRRIISGPVPAVQNLEIEQKKGQFLIADGEATWEGMDLDTCQDNIDDWGYTSFMHEAQHSVEPPPGGMFDHLDFESLRVRFEDIKDKIIRTVTWVDPAVSNTDSSDSYGINIASLLDDGRIVRLYSWEDRTSPEDALRRAILKSIEYGSTVVGVETDQGGDTWRPIFTAQLAEIEAELSEAQEEEVRVYVSFASAKAGSVGSKIHRASLMLSDYERANILHAEGTHAILEHALKRFPKTKPFDLVDCSFWSWWDLRNPEDEEDDVIEHEERVSISVV